MTVASVVTGLSVTCSSLAPCRRAEEKRFTAPSEVTAFWPSTF